VGNLAKVISIHQKGQDFNLIIKLCTPILDMILLKPAAARL
jgi:hypothetical protein